MNAALYDWRTWIATGAVALVALLIAAVLHASMSHPAAVVPPASTPPTQTVRVVTTPGHITVSAAPARTDPQSSPATRGVNPRATATSGPSAKPTPPNRPTPSPSATCVVTRLCLPPRAVPELGRGHHL